MSSERERPDASASDSTKSGSDSPDATESGSKPSGSADSDAAARTGDRYSVEPEDTRRSPALIATAVALPVVLIVVVLAIAVFARQHPTREPLALGSVPQPQATGQVCTTLLPALPSSLGGYTKADLAQPAPPGTVGWQLPDGGDPIVLRCGLDRPAEFVQSAALQVINGVNWFEVRDPTSGVTSGTWYVVDRGTYIAVTMPDKAGPTPLQDISNAVSKVLPARPIDPAPIPH
ncbi:DUF3515 domain-containing protein [Nocardia miyunensis]|uniref:DUF3515 domain-containing protein n=1 Tax=Nocardia miyunensis TaxID=282684 RepID=UPI00082C6FEB|nr:DUF3515 domain-containing protein [Nocardia miyunensis]